MRQVQLNSLVPRSAIFDCNEDILDIESFHIDMVNFLERMLITEHAATDVETVLEEKLNTRLLLKVDSCLDSTKLFT